MNLEHCQGAWRSRIMKSLQMESCRVWEKITPRSRSSGWEYQQRRGFLWHKSTLVLDAFGNSSTQGNPSGNAAAHTRWDNDTRLSRRRSRQTGKASSSCVCVCVRAMNARYPSDAGNSSDRPPCSIFTGGEQSCEAKMGAEPNVNQPPGSSCVILAALTDSPLR